MGLLLLLCICSVFFCTSGESVHDEDTLVHILTELKKLQGAQNECAYKLSELDEYKSRVLSLENTVKDLQDTVKDLQRKNNEIFTEIHQLTDNSGQNANVKDYESKIEEHFKGTLNVDDRDEILNITNPLQIRLKETKPESQRKRQIADTHVAFTAALSARGDITLGDIHTVIFDRVFTNIGNAYHQYTGIFLAPVKGAYVFSITMMVSPGKSLFLEIVKDGNPVNYINANARSVNDWISTTKQWTLEINKGSEVWIRSHSQGQLHGNLHSIFSGFLLFETV